LKQKLNDRYEFKPQPFKSRDASHTPTRGQVKTDKDQTNQDATQTDRNATEADEIAA